MNSYLIVCGVIFNLLVLFAVVGSIITEISASRYNKKKAAEKAKLAAAYKEELKLAEQAWQQWARKINELAAERNKETNDMKRFHIEMEMLQRKYNEYYRFSSTGKRVPFYALGEENNWALQEKPLTAN